MLQVECVSRWGCLCLYLGRGERNRRREQRPMRVLAEGTQGVTVER